MTVLSGLGVAIVFAAVFIRAAEGRRGKKERKPDGGVEAGGIKRTKPLGVAIGRKI